MTERTFTFPRYEMAAPILGMQERNLKIIVEELPCQVVSRGDTLQLKGDDEIVNQFWRVLEELVFLYKESSAITEQQIRMAVRMVKSGKADLLHTMFEDTINVTMKGRMITPKTEGQKVYVDSIRRNTITFGIGPAGTGKTFLAVVLAAFYLKNRDVERIILTRPAVEAGEKLGYLPGDLKEKVDPYLRPLYDALNDMFGLEQVDRFMLRGIIEVAPLAYMRGRTLENAFIILDEAQNTTPEQMKMFLTRLGNNSKMVINGDRTQIDLPGRMVSGLIEAENVLTGLAGISMVHFTDADVVRHDLVSKIIRAYERYEVKRTGRDLNKPLSKQKNDKTDKQAKADKTVKNDSTDVIAKEFDTPVQKTDTTQEEGR